MLTRCIVSIVMGSKRNLSGLLKTGDADFREILKHSAWAMAIFIIAAISQFFFDLLLARNYGAEGAGFFYLSFSVLAIFALISRLGFNKAVVKFLPPLIADNELAKAHGLKRKSFGLTLLFSLASTLVLIVSAPLISEGIFNQPELTTKIRLISLAVPGLALIYLQAGFLRGLKLIKESVVIERVGIYALGVIVLLLFGQLVGVEGIILGFVIATYITAIAGAWIINRHMGKTRQSIAFSGKLLLAVGAPLLFVEFSNQMTGQINVLVLGALESPASVGVFNIALKVSLFLNIILTAVSYITTTKISEFYSKNNIHKLETAASKSAGLALVAGLPLMIMMFISPELILGLFGSEFTDGALLLRILVVAQLINLATGTAPQILAMTGYQNTLAAILGVTLLIVNGALSLLLVPIYGINGAGFAVGSSIVISNLLILLSVKKYLGIWSLPHKAFSTWYNTLATKARQKSS
jgi:O-antigen/teichoic acid export membrane protein